MLSCFVYWHKGELLMELMEHITNFRELKAYPTKDHKTMIAGKLYRSGNLNNLNTADWEQLKALHIQDIVDFRSKEEKREHPYNIIENINYHDCVALHTREGLENFYFFMLINADSSPEDVLQASRFVREGYKELPFHNKAYKKVFDLMLSSDQAILFHCSSGKDRTGLMAALILKLLDVEDELIMQDYLLSNEKVMANTICHVQELGFVGEVKDALIYCCSVHKELLQSSFDEILKRYHDWNEYFKQEFDIDEGQIQILKKKYLR